MSLHHPVFSRLYPVVGRAMDRGGMWKYRRALLSGLEGKVVEIGAGNGLNFPHYPDTVTRVIAMEPEQRLRHLACIAGDTAPVPVEVVDGFAEHLSIEDDSIDAAVVCLVLCSVADQSVALREIRRVLKPGGQLRFLEHVRADTPGLARVQRVLDATVWPRLAAGCHTGRDTARVLKQTGFTFERLERFVFPNPRTPTSAHILGTAVTQSSD